MSKKEETTHVYLHNAKLNKKDEFYTQLADIEREFKHYKEYFFDKTVLCNCDDPRFSNFTRYFQLNFEALGLKKLICTHFDAEKATYKLEITRNEKLLKNGSVQIGLPDFIETPLTQNGDFRSPECIELLKEADIVCTNPPFSLFREYIALLEEYNKKFIVIGNTNALTYKEIFKLIKEDRIRTGYTNFNVGMYFYVPDTYEKYHKIEDGRKMVRVSTSCWFTNMEVKKHKETMILYKPYIEEEYQKYYNFDAINIDKVQDIPVDWEGLMGVPITFLDKYNPDQFEIIGLGISNSGLSIGVKPYTPEHKKYRKEVQHKGAVDGDLYMLDENNNPKVPYARVIIKRK